MSKFKDHTGDVNYNSQGLRMTILEYRGVRNVDVSFEDGSLIKNCSYSNFKKGMGVIPVKRESKNISLSINTKVGNPKGAVMLADKLQKEIESYDDFMKFTGVIRNTVVMEKAEKLKLLSFVNNEDFKYIFDKGKGKIVLELFYKEKINGIDFSNKKK